MVLMNVKEVLDQEVRILKAEESEMIEVSLVCRPADGSSERVMRKTWFTVTEFLVRSGITKEDCIKAFEEKS